MIWIRLTVIAIALVFLVVLLVGLTQLIALTPEPYRVPVALVVWGSVGGSFFANFAKALKK